MGAWSMGACPHEGAWQGLMLGLELVGALRYRSMGRRPIGKEMRWLDPVSEGQRAKQGARLPAPRR